MTHEELVEKVAEAICQKTLFDGTGHGCGGFCQARGRFGRQARAAIAEVLAVLEALAPGHEASAGSSESAVRLQLAVLKEPTQDHRSASDMLSASPLAPEEPK